jgi:hypothetical protein
LFIQPGDAIALAGAIQRLVQDPPLLRKLAINARNAYERYFGLERFGKEFLGVVEEAIQNESLTGEEDRRSRADPGATKSQLSEQQRKELQNLACR